MNMMVVNGLLKHTGLGGNMTPQKRLQQLAAANRTQPEDEGMGFGPVPTHEQLLQEVWYLRRRVKQLEQQNLNYSWQLNPESMGR